jgi:hypothetical protein
MRNLSEFLVLSVKHSVEGVTDTGDADSEGGGKFLNVGNVYRVDLTPA